MPPGQSRSTSKSPGSASLGYNYNISGATEVSYGVYTVTIPDDTDSATVQVNPLDTSTVGGSETVALNLENNNGYTVDSDNNAATVTIYNNDLPTVSIAAGANNTFTVSRNGPTGEPLAVPYTTGGSAANGVDYQTLSGTVVIPAGGATATIAITPLPDAGGGNHTVALALGPGSGYTVSQYQGSGTLTITNTDSGNPQAPAMSEFLIGSGGTFAVPAGATTLYLGIHDGGCWADEWGSISATLTWDVGGSTSVSVSAGCVFFALAPSGAPRLGPYGEGYPPYQLYDYPNQCGPVAVSIPSGATSVTIAASGTWGWGGGGGTTTQYESQYQCGPGGSGSTGTTSSSYMQSAYNSQNMTSCSCPSGALVGVAAGRPDGDACGVQHRGGRGGPRDLHGDALEGGRLPDFCPVPDRGRHGRGRDRLHRRQRDVDLLARPDQPNGRGPDPVRRQRDERSELPPRAGHSSPSSVNGGGSSGTGVVEEW